MDGYHLEYVGRNLPYLSVSTLTEKGFDDEMLDEFIDLFDRSYEQLNIENHWQVDAYARSVESFGQKLNLLNECGQVQSFWKDNQLIGAYIFEQNYITDIVVDPLYQNNGYGSYILAHCIRNMSGRKSIQNIRLRVAKSNSGAKKLYERRGFVPIACFAEHTYS